MMTGFVRMAEPYRRKIIGDAGWRLGSSLEDRVAWWLHRGKFNVGAERWAVRQQYKIGRYRVDFAWPDVKIALEVDGWYHRSPEGAAKDAERDSWLRSQEWLVLRVDDRHGEESLDKQIVRVCQIVHDAIAWAGGR